MLENKQSREMIDSTYLIISMTYEQRRETYRIVFRCFGPRRGAKRNAGVGSGRGLVSRARQVGLLKALGLKERRALAPEGATKASASWRLWSVPSGKSVAGPFEAATAPQNEVLEMDTEGTKKVAQKSS